MFHQKFVYLQLIFILFITTIFIAGCGNKADSYNKKGLVFYDQRKYDKAITEFKKALEVNPNHYEAHFDLGMAYYSKGMIDESIKELKRAIEIDPNKAKAHYNIAFAYMANEDALTAIQKFEKAIQSFSDKNEKKKEAEAYLYLSVAHSLLEEHEKALDICKKAIQTYPKLEKGHYFLGVCYYKNEMYDEAIAELKKTIELNPESEKAHSVLYAIYDRLGKSEEAMKHRMVLQRLSQQRRGMQP